MSWNIKISSKKCPFHYSYGCDIKSIKNEDVTCNEETCPMKE